MKGSKERLMSSGEENTESHGLSKLSQANSQRSRLGWMVNKRIGRRTGKLIGANKPIRKDEHGFEVFDDYLSSESDMSSFLSVSTASTSKRSAFASVAADPESQEEEEESKENRPRPVNGAVDNETALENNCSKFTSSQSVMADSQVSKQSSRLGWLRNKKIGRRTGKLVTANKHIRKDEHGFEVFEDYFSPASEASSSRMWDMSSVAPDPDSQESQNDTHENETEDDSKREVDSDIEDETVKDELDAESVEKGRAEIEEIEEVNSEENTEDSEEEEEQEDSCEEDVIEEREEEIDGVEKSGGEVKEREVNEEEEEFDDDDDVIEEEEEDIPEHSESEIEEGRVDKEEESDDDDMIEEEEEDSPENSESEIEEGLVDKEEKESYTEIEDKEEEVKDDVETCKTEIELDNAEESDNDISHNSSTQRIEHVSGEHSEEDVQGSDAEVSEHCEVNDNDSDDEVEYNQDVDKEVDESSQSLEKTKTNEDNDPGEQEHHSDNDISSDDVEQSDNLTEYVDAEPEGELKENEEGEDVSKLEAESETVVQEDAGIDVAGNVLGSITRHDSSSQQESGVNFNKTRKRLSYSTLALDLSEESLKARKNRIDAANADLQTEAEVTASKQEKTKGKVHIIKSVSHKSPKTTTCSTKTDLATTKEAIMETPKSEKRKGKVNIIKSSVSLKSSEIAKSSSKINYATTKQGIVETQKPEKSKGKVHIIKTSVSQKSPEASTCSTKTTLVTTEEEEDFLCLAPRSILPSRTASEHQDTEDDELSIVEDEEENIKAFKKSTFVHDKTKSKQSKSKKDVKAKSKHVNTKTAKKKESDIKSKNDESGKKNNKNCDSITDDGKQTSENVQSNTKSKNSAQKRKLSFNHYDEDFGHQQSEDVFEPNESLLSKNKRRSMSDSNDEGEMLTQSKSPSVKSKKSVKTSRQKKNSKSQEVSKEASSTRKRASTYHNDEDSIPHQSEDVFETNESLLSKNKRRSMSDSNDDGEMMTQSKLPSAKSKISVKTSRQKKISKSQEVSKEASSTRKRASTYHNDEDSIPHQSEDVFETNESLLSKNKRRSMSDSNDEGEMLTQSKLPLVKSKRSVKTSRQKKISKSQEVSKEASSTRKRASTSDSNEEVVSEKSTKQSKVKGKSVKNQRSKSTSDSNADNEDSESEGKLKERVQSKDRRQSSKGSKVEDVVSPGSRRDSRPSYRGGISSTPVAGVSMTVPTNFGSGISFNVTRRSTLLGNIGSGYVGKTTVSRPRSSSVELTPCITKAGKGRKSKGRRVTICPEENVEHQITSEYDDQTKNNETAQMSTTALPSPSSTPVHFAEMTNTATPGPVQADEDLKVTGDPLIVPEPAPSGMRRSKRTRLKPVAWYKNERVVFDHTSTSGPVIVGVAPSLEVKWKKLERERQMRRKLREEIRKAAKKDKFPSKRLSIHTKLPDDFVPSSDREITVFNVFTQQEDEMECVMPYDGVEPLGPQHKSPQKDDPYLISQLLTHPCLSAGHITIRPNAEKPEQLVVKTAVVFHVAHGKILAKIHKTSSVLQTGDSFCVPIGNTYSIKNLRSDTARLFYTIVKDNQVLPDGDSDAEQSSKL